MPAGNAAPGGQEPLDALAENAFPAAGLAHNGQGLPWGKREAHVPHRLHLPPWGVDGHAQVVDVQNFAHRGPPWDKIWDAPSISFVGAVACPRCAEFHTQKWRGAKASPGGEAGATLVATDEVEAINYHHRLVRRCYLRPHPSRRRRDTFLQGKAFSVPSGLTSIFSAQISQADGRGMPPPLQCLAGAFCFTAQKAHKLSEGNAPLRQQKFS